MSESTTLHDDDENVQGSEEKESGGSITEAQIINHILNNRSLSIFTSNGLDISYFPGYQDELQFILDHFNQYKQIPDITTFLNKFPDFPSFDLDEAPQAMVFSIKESKGYELIAPALRDIDQAARTNSIEAARLMKQKAEDILAEVSLQRFSSGLDLFRDAHVRFEEYLRRIDHRGTIGCIFGIPSFDAATGGVWENDFLGLVGRPGEGKSWILEYLLLQTWLNQDKKVLLFSLENTKDMVGFRADSLLAHFSNFALMTGRDVLEWKEAIPVRTMDDYRVWIDSLATKGTPFEVLDNQDSATGSFTIEDILEIIKQKKPDIVGIDQLSLIASRTAYKTIRESYIHITRSIRQFVNEVKIPVYLNCQAGRDASKVSNKDKDSNTPELHQIAESDSVGQDATKILTLKNKDGILKISLKKNTMGRSGLDALMAWDIDSGTLKPVSDADNPDPTTRF